MSLNPTTVPGAELTRNEKRAMRLRSFGYERREVAEIMNISRATVGQYFQQVKVKLEATDLNHATEIYRERYA